MKSEKYFDVVCYICNSHLSTDFRYGFMSSEKEAVEGAKQEGFREVDGKILCPVCLHWKEIGFIKEEEIK